MTIAYADVADEVLREIPEFRPIHDEHVADYDQVLQHLLVADLSRFTIAAYRNAESDLVARALGLMERLMAEGDYLTIELVAVSFVENIAPTDADAAFFDLYGPRLCEHSSDVGAGASAAPVKRIALIAGLLLAVVGVAGSRHQARVRWCKPAALRSGRWSTSWRYSKRWLSRRRRRARSSSVSRFLPTADSARH